MNTIAYGFILVALLLIRQVTRGRVMYLGHDLTDAFIAIVNGSPDGLGEVLTRSGDSNTPDSATVAKAQPSGGSVNLAAQTVALGTAAKGYRLGATGPDYYDCSGLLWRACQKVGYNGPRFVTGTVSAMPGFTRVADPTVNDIVLWPAHHMGVITSPGTFYSARNPKVGIGYAKIDGFRKDAPIYLRYGGAK